MFAQVALFIVSLAIFQLTAALPANTVALPNPSGVLPRSGGGVDVLPRGGDKHDSGIDKSCNTGPVQCCNSVHSANDATVQTLAGILPIGLQDVTGQIGLACNPISALVGVAGNSCSSQPVCCSKNNFNGLIVVGCTPVNVNL